MLVLVGGAPLGESCLDELILSNSGEKQILQLMQAWSGNAKKTRNPGSTLLGLTDEVDYLLAVSFLQLVFPSFLYKILIILTKMP